MIGLKTVVVGGKGHCTIPVRSQHQLAFLLSSHSGIASDERGIVYARGEKWVYEFHNRRYKRLGGSSSKIIQYNDLAIQFVVTG
jgi:hypothetical protein